MRDTVYLCAVSLLLKLSRIHRVAQCPGGRSMTNFTDFTLNYGVDEIDRRVLETGGYLTSISQGYTLRSEVPNVGDWSFKWINTQGCGNHGTLIAIPKSKRTADIVRKGRINAIHKLCGDQDFAELYTDLSKGVQYSLEAKVTVVVYKHHLQLAGLNPASWREAEASLGEEMIKEIKERGLSFWRLQAAIIMSDLIVKSYV